MILVLIFWIVLVLGRVWCENCESSQLDLPCPYDAFPDPGCFPGENFPSAQSIGPNVKTIDNEKYPYIVSLQKLKCGNHKLGNGCYEHFCGGTMIAKNLILTAAHRFDDLKSLITYRRSDGQPYYRPKQPIYAAISPKCRHLSNEKFGRFQVKSIIIHPEYSNRPIYTNDVAIVDIYSNDNGQFYSDRVVEVITADTTEDVFNAQLLGYGEVHPDDVGKYTVHLLHGAPLKMLDYGFCQGLLQGFENASSSLLNYTNMVCYWDWNADACDGDSGGPLLLNNKDVQIGLVSWGPGGGCSNADAMQAPGVYVRLTLFANWIQQIVKKYSTEPAAELVDNFLTAEPVVELPAQEPVAQPMTETIRVPSPPPPATMPPSPSPPSAMPPTPPPPTPPPPPVLTPRCQEAYDNCVEQCGAPELIMDFQCNDEGFSISRSCNCQNVPVTTPTPSDQFIDPDAPISSCPPSRCLNSAQPCCEQYANSTEGPCSTRFREYTFGGYCDYDSDGVATNIIVTQPLVFPCVCA